MFTKCLKFNVGKLKMHKEYNRKLAFWKKLFMLLLLLTADADYSFSFLLKQKRKDTCLFFNCIF